MSAALPAFPGAYPGPDTYPADGWYPDVRGTATFLDRTAASAAEYVHTAATATALVPTGPTSNGAA